MKKCKNCSRGYNHEYTYCPYCGTKFKSDIEVITEYFEAYEFCWDVVDITTEDYSDVVYDVDDRTPPKEKIIKIWIKEK